MIGIADEIGGSVENRLNGVRARQSARGQRVARTCGSRADVNRYGTADGCRSIENRERLRPLIDHSGRTGDCRVELDGSVAEYGGRAGRGGDCRCRADDECLAGIGRSDEVGRAVVDRLNHVRVRRRALRQRVTRARATRADVDRDGSADRSRAVENRECLGPLIDSARRARDRRGERDRRLAERRRGARRRGRRRRRAHGQGLAAVHRAAVVRSPIVDRLNCVRSCRRAAGKNVAGTLRLRRSRSR